MSINSLSVGLLANKQTGSVKGSPSDASLITSMRRAAVNVQFQYAATSGNTVPANNKKVLTDQPNTRGFADSPYISAVGRGLSKNFLKTL
uniref:Uncharacterized protein n=1 Tax=viral metagenome TaxID=1070528 RepID=A0A6C0KC08_9ZZZZ